MVAHVVGTRKREPARSRKHLVAALAAVAVAVAAGAGYLLSHGGGGPSGSPEALAEQMEAAAAGMPAAVNVFGGGLLVDHGSGAVTVDRIPPSACVSAGWQLVRKGLVSINGVMPARVSAAKLSELCNMYDTASLSWTPKQAE